MPSRADPGGGARGVDEGQRVHAAARIGRALVARVRILAVCVRGGGGLLRHVLGLRRPFDDLERAVAADGGDATLRTAGARCVALGSRYPHALDAQLGLVEEPEAVGSGTGFHPAKAKRVSVRRGADALPPARILDGGQGSEREVEALPVDEARCDFETSNEHPVGDGGGAPPPGCHPAPRFGPTSPACRAAGDRVETNVRRRAPGFG